MTDLTDRISPRVLHVSLLVIAALIFGAIFPVNRYAAEAGWQPMSFAYQQALIGGLLLAIIGLLWGRPLGLTKTHILAYTLIGGLGVGLPMGLLVKVAGHLDASVVTLVLCLSPLLTVCIGSILGIERPSARLLAGMLVGIVAIAIIVTPQSAVLRDGTSGWFVLSLGVPLMLAGANNLAKYLRPASTTSLAMASGTLLGAAAVGLVVLLLLGESMIWPPPAKNQLIPLISAAIINASFYFLFFEIIRIMGPARFSLFNYLAVAAGVMWSVIIFDEQPSKYYWLAIFMMFGGVYLSISKRSG